MKLRVLTLLTFCALQASAQSRDSVLLNPVSVTGSRFAQQTNTTGRNVTVLEGSAMQQLPVRSLDDLLRYVPGVEVQSRGPLGAQSDIVIRGGTYQQVLVLLDGVKVNDPITGHFNGYIPVTPSEIERIEILRGPAAAVYGAEAVGGVIHVITKTFSGSQAQAGFHGYGKATAGEYNFWQADAGASVNTKNVRVSGGVFSNNTDGQLLRGNQRGYVFATTATASVKVLLKNNWSLALRGTLDKRAFSAQNFYTTFASDTASENVSIAWGQAQLKKERSRGSDQLDILVKGGEDQYLYNPASIANNNRSVYAMGQYVGLRRLSEHWQASGGFQASQRSIRSNDRGDHNTGQAAVFATALYTQNRLHLGAGLRGDYDENYGFAVLPQVNAAYVLRRVTFRAQAGTAVRSADFTERFNNYNKTALKSGSIGNPDLKAEQSVNAEAGVNVQPAKGLQLLATAFLRKQNDMIDWTQTAYADMPRKENLAPGGSFALAKNVAEVQTKGLEFQVDYLWQKNKHGLRANAGLTLVKSDAGNVPPSFYIISHAKMLVQSTLMYTFGRLSLSGNMLYKERDVAAAKGIGAEISSSYLLVNARAGFSFLRNQQLTVFANCNNIGDVSYSDLLGSKMPKRWLSAGASYRF